jgi:NTF2-related export protein 1/2
VNSTVYAPAGPLTFETGSQPPSLLITVSGNVTHGGGPGANPLSTHKKVIEGHPRVFSQTFMLVPDNTAPTKVGEVAKYYIIADTMRFVG